MNINIYSTKGENLQRKRNEVKCGQFCNLIFEITNPPKNKLRKLEEI